MKIFVTTAQTEKETAQTAFPISQGTPLRFWKSGFAVMGHPADDMSTTEAKVVDSVCLKKNDLLYLYTTGNERYDIPMTKREVDAEINVILKAAKAYPDGTIVKRGR